MTFLDKSQKISSEIFDLWDSYWWDRILPMMEFSYCGLFEYIYVIQSNKDEGRLIDYSEDGKNEIAFNIDEYCVEEEILKAFYVYIFSILDSYIENIFEGKLSYSSEYHWKILSKLFKKYCKKKKIKFKDGRFSRNLARYNFLLQDLRHGFVNINGKLVNDFNKKLKSQFYKIITDRLIDKAVDLMLKNE